MPCSGLIFQSMMTMADREVKATRMFRRGILLLAMLIASLTAMASVHAAEFRETIVIDCAGNLHSEGDDDQSSGDADKGAPHHHGSCHGAASVLPTRTGIPALRTVLSTPTGFDNHTVPGRWNPGPAIRPPIA
jgi:hypothetical protein